MTSLDVLLFFLCCNDIHKFVSECSLCVIIIILECIGVFDVLSYRYHHGTDLILLLFYIQHNINLIVNPT